MDGKVAEGIAWLRAGLQLFEVEIKDKSSNKGLLFRRLRKDLAEKREDRRVEKETAWGMDAGRLEETRILEMLDIKWIKINDTIIRRSRSNELRHTKVVKMNTQVLPQTNSLLAKMPSGREVYTVKPYKPPMLDRDMLEVMRSLPDGEDDMACNASSEDDARPHYENTIDDDNNPTSSGGTYY